MTQPTILEDETALLPRTPDGVARIALSGDIYNEPWTCVFHVKFDAWAAATHADLVSFVDAFAGDFAADILPSLDENVHLTNATAVLFLASPDVLAVSRTYAYAGGVTTDAESNQACYIISWQIAASYRGGKPRTYLPGVTEELTIQHRELTPTFMANLVGHATTWRTAVAGAGGAHLTNPQLGTVSYRTGNAPRVAAIFRPFIGEVVHPRLGTQRRRLGKWRP